MKRDLLPVVQVVTLIACFFVMGYLIETSEF